VTDELIKNFGVLGAILALIWLMWKGVLPWVRESQKEAMEALKAQNEVSRQGLKDMADGLGRVLEKQAVNMDKIADRLGAMDLNLTKINGSLERIEKK
jgi:hypothetical protein